MDEQSRYDALLAKAIADISALGHVPIGTIDPHVRITRNRTALGSCRDRAGALYRMRGKRGSVACRDGMIPVFEISCSRNAGGSDAEILDVLYHEVIHTLPGCYHHTRAFKEIAAEVNSAYGASVQVRKEDAGSGSARAMGRDEARRLVGALFSMDGKKYRLIEFKRNSPKWCCVLRESSGSNVYLTTLEGLSSMELLGK
jgi:hypothetical protein